MKNLLHAKTRSKSEFKQDAGWYDLLQPSDKSEWDVLTIRYNTASLPSEKSECDVLTIRYNTTSLPSEKSQCDVLTIRYNTASLPSEKSECDVLTIRYNTTSLPSDKSEWDVLTIRYSFSAKWRVKLLHQECCMVPGTISPSFTPIINQCMEDPADIRTAQNRIKITSLLSLLLKFVYSVLLLKKNKKSPKS